MAPRRARTRARASGAHAARRPNSGVCLADHGPYRHSMGEAGVPATSRGPYDPGSLTLSASM
jgi:hypothetical protein